MITEEYVPLDYMISMVQRYIWVQTGKHIVITPPQNDHQLQLLGKAFDIARNRV